MVLSAMSEVVRRGEREHERCPPFFLLNSALNRERLVIIINFLVIQVGYFWSKIELSVNR